MERFPLPTVPLLAPASARQGYSLKLLLLLPALLLLALLFLLFGGRTSFDSSQVLAPPPKSCPGSRALIHTTCALEFTIPDFPCKLVQDEVERRVLGRDGWTDPKHGKYVLMDSNHADGQNQTRSTLAIRTSGTEPRRLEMLQFHYHALDATTARAACNVSACSQSQERSVYDHSSNFCNIRNLVCGTQQGCAIAKHDMNLLKDFHYVDCSFHAPKQCYKKP